MGRVPVMMVVTVMMVVVVSASAGFVVRVVVPVIVVAVIGMLVIVRMTMAVVMMPVPVPVPVMRMVMVTVRGMIVAPASGEDNHHLAALLRDGVPLVLVDRQADALACDSVTVDNEGGAFEAVNYMIASGHRRIALIHDDSRIVTARQRLAGYLRSLSENGLAVDDRLVAVSQSTVEHAIDTTIRLVSQPDRPTALFTVDSQMTTGALLALRAMGLSVPQDVSLVGFDDFDLATFTDPQITVVAQPVAQIGPLAVRMLVERIEGSDAPPRRVRFPTRLIARGSVARPGFGRR